MTSTAFQSLLDFIFLQNITSSGKIKQMDKENFLRNELLNDNWLTS
jgi:hypothetical protein